MASSARTVLAVVDCSVFLTHPVWTRDDDPTAVIASIPWTQELGARTESILLILPEVVIRELDRLKESSNQQLRYRASVTLAVIDKLIPNPYGTVMIRPRDGWGTRPSAACCPAARAAGRVFYEDPAHRPRWFFRWLTRRARLKAATALSQRK